MMLIAGNGAVGCQAVRRIVPESLQSIWLNSQVAVPRPLAASTRLQPCMYSGLLDVHSTDYRTQKQNRPSQTVVSRASRRLPSLSDFPASATASLHPFDHSVQPGLLAGSLCDAWINSADVGFTDCESQSIRVDPSSLVSVLHRPRCLLKCLSLELSRGFPESFSGSCHGGRRLPSASLAASPAAQLLHHLLRCCTSPVGVVPVGVAVDCLAAAHRSETTRERNQNSPFWQRVLLERTNRSESPARDLDALLPPTAPAALPDPWPATGDASNVPSRCLLCCRPASSQQINEPTPTPTSTPTPSLPAHPVPSPVIHSSLRRSRRPSARV